MRNPELRAAEADRRQTVAELQRHYVDGRLNEDELGDRVAQALAARTYGDLDALLRDLPAAQAATTRAPAPSVSPSRHAARTSDTERGTRRRERGFRAHLTSYLAVMTLLVVIWLLTTPGGYFWPMWPMLGWGIGLAKHARAHSSRCGLRDSHDARDVYNTRPGAPALL